MAPSHAAAQAAVWCAADPHAVNQATIESDPNLFHNALQESRPELGCIPAAGEKAVLDSAVALF